MAFGINFVNGERVKNICVLWKTFINYIYGIDIMYKLCQWQERKKETR